MLKLISKPAVKLVERYLPDPYIFVLLLTLIAAVAAIAVERQTPLAVLRMWGDGFWGLLTFSMQMLLVLVTGFILATSPPVKRLLEWLAGFAKTAGAAIIALVAPGSIVPGPIRGVSRNYACTRAGGRSMVAVQSGTADHPKYTCRPKVSTKW